MQSLSGTLQTKYLPSDGYSHVPAAGKCTADGQRAADCLRWDSDKPSTPDHIQKYRSPICHEPGQIERHFGLADDALPVGPFGSRTKWSEAAGECIRSYPTTEIGLWKLGKSEEIYASTRSEPLGKPLTRSHQLPPHMGTTRPFGMTNNIRELERSTATKELIYPAPQQEQATDARLSESYVARHGYDGDGPGEQRRRQYNWQSAGIDPSTHAFGRKVDGDIRDGVKKSLAPALDEGVLQPPKVVSKVYEDFQMTHADVLGRPRLLGARKQDLPAEHVFGKPSAPPGGEPSAGEVMRGEYSPQEQAPDPDLGKSLRQGFRNMAPPDRVYGLPSIRTDARRPERPSVGSTMNYGNEPNAQQLLRPPATAEMGVNEEHYVLLRSKEELQSVVETAALGLSMEEFEAVFAAAVQSCGQEKYCSLDSFLKCRHDMLARRLGL